jgi:hypothetical protein
MIVILGLVILVAAVVVGVAGVLANGGHAHAVTHFAVFGYHVTGSTGTLFLSGIVVGALALAGLSLLLAGARRTSRRGRDARRGLAQSRLETATVSADRDDLRDQRDTARAYTASTLGDNGATPNGSARAYTAGTPADDGSAPNGSAPNGSARAYTASTLGDDSSAPNGTARPHTGSTLADDSSAPNGTVPNGTVPNGTVPNGTVPNGTDPGPRGPSLFARLVAGRPASPRTDPQPDAPASQASAAQAESPADQATAVPADASAPAE